MKRLLILLLFVTCSMVGQEFEITPFGFASKTNEKQSYVVLEFPGKTKAEIYKAVLVKLNSMYNSPKDVLSVVENESITINAVDRQLESLNGTYFYDLHYIFRIDFKDNKLKFEVFNINIFESFFVNKDNSKEIYIYNQEASINNVFLKSKIDSSFFVLKKDLKEMLDNWLNEYLIVLKTEISRANDW